MNLRFIGKCNEQEQSAPVVDCYTHMNSTQIITFYLQVSRNFWVRDQVIVCFLGFLSEKVQQKKAKFVDFTTLFCGFVFLAEQKTCDTMSSAGILAPTKSSFLKRPFTEEVQILWTQLLPHAKPNWPHLNHTYEGTTEGWKMVYGNQGPSIFDSCAMPSSQ